MVQPVRGKRTIPDTLKAFLHHGVEVSNHPKQAKGTCPFCDKSNHFFIQSETGRYHCKICDESGNVNTFINRLHQWGVDETTDQDFQPLIDRRGIPLEVLKTWGVCQSQLTGEWLVPAYNNKGKLCNLSREVEVDDGKFRLFGTASCKLHPFGVNVRNSRNKTVWVCEGPWDAMALWSALRGVRKNGPRLVRTTNPDKSLGMTHDVLGVPGSGNFNPDWLEYLDGKTARLCFDNDHPRKTPSGKTVKPGWDGMVRVGKLAGENGRCPSRLERIKWGRGGYDKGLADGYDVRDTLGDNGPVNGIGLILSRMERVKVKKTEGTPEAEEVQLEPLPRESFAELVEDYNACLHFTDNLRDTLALMLACVISTELPEDQVWLRIIGPPGSGKSTLAEAISAARDFTFPVSMQTGFHSGYVGDGKAASRKKDASLIPMMDGRTVIIKDADTLLNAPGKDRILSEMRDIYDGTTRSRYRNRVARVYEDIRTTFIICGTDALRTLNRTFLGERFLDVEIMERGADQTPFLDRALDNTFNRLSASLLPPKDEDPDDLPEDRMVRLKRATLGFLQFMKGNLRTMKPPSQSEKAKVRIKALGQFISYMRARKDKDGEAQYKARVELATRLVSTLGKLAFTSALTLGKRSVDAEVLGLLCKVALDTAEGFRLDLVDVLAGVKPGSGLSTKQLETTIHVSEGTIRNLLIEMREFGITQRKSENNKSGQRGRNRHTWSLTEDFRKLHRIAMGPQPRKGTS